MITLYSKAHAVSTLAALAASLLWCAGVAGNTPSPKPNVVLVMTDDQGWGDTGYNGHPILKTPNLDAMAKAGVRFDRFYAAHHVCSPTRGAFLTGRNPNRFGCFSHGYPIKPQEITIAQIAKSAGYATGHFGKWHLNGVKGAGKPIPADDPLNPGKLGFDQWVSVSNYYDLNPAMARNGVTEQFTGDSSDIATDEALKFIRSNAEAGKPFLAVVWFGSPHGPHKALPKDKEAYADQPAKDQDYYGELAAVDRSVGRLRETLRELKADNTILLFTSDNGGAHGPLSTGQMRGAKGSFWEGGIRVPGLLEWPARVKTPIQTSFPVVTSDIAPTIIEAIGEKYPDPDRPLDGISLIPLLEGKMTERPTPIGFWNHLAKPGHSAWIDWPYKLHLNAAAGARARQADAAGEKPPGVLLYDLSKDPKETTDLAAKEPERAGRMRAALEAWQKSVDRSLAGEDY